jgi:polyferredoxin
MEKQVNFLDPLIENTREYAKTSIELYKLQAVEKTSDITSTLVSRAVAFSVFGLFVLMVSFGVAFWLGDLLGKVYYGFLCVGGVYGVAGAVLYFFLHRWMKEQATNSMIQQLLG